MADPVYFVNPPANCDTCEEPVGKKFYDAACLIQGRRIAASICPTCFNFGPGLGKLGTGLGQEYTRQPDGRFLKTGG
jgi:hypothetical protein